MIRIRFIYEKRNGACFVPHVALSAVFSRAASRAGLKLSMTQGFSPKAKISFGPELPAGVVALAEPVDIFFEKIPENSIKIINILNNSMPDGFKLYKIFFPEENSPSLGKICETALYILKFKNLKYNSSPDANEFFGDSVIKFDRKNDEWLNLVLKDPARNGIGGWIKNLIIEEKIKGWQDVNIVRAAIGRWDGKRIFINA